MSVLLIGGRADVVEALVGRLVGQGDDVRVVDPDGVAGERWRALGAHVARGPLYDADLLERAAQNVRTIVLLDEDPELDAVIEAAARASVGRIVWLTPRGTPELARLLAAGLDYVAIEVPLTGWRKRPALSPEDVAEAVDAADDLAGNPRLEVDLGEPEGWARLNLDEPNA